MDKLEAKKIIKRAVEVSGLGSARQLSKHFGYDPNTLAKYAHRGTLPGEAFRKIIELCLERGANLDELITGIKRLTFDPADVPAPEVHFVNPPEAALPESEYLPIPLLPDEIAAGFGRKVYPDNQLPEEYFIIRISRVSGRGPFFAVSVDGESMEPTIPDGSIVIVDASPHTRRDIKKGIFAVRLSDNRLTIKRLRLHEDRYLFLLADNPEALDNDILMLDLEEDPDPIIGEVVGVWKELL